MMPSRHRRIISLPKSSSKNQNPPKMSRRSSRSSNGLYWSYTIGKGPYKGIIENQEIWKVGLSQTHASGNRDPSTHNYWWHANWWKQVPSKKDQDGHGLMKSENFEGIPYPDDDLNNFLSRWSWSDECYFFLHKNCLDNFKKFRTHVVATIVCMTAWCTYTHLLHAHFSAHSACTITFAHLRACHTHAWLKWCLHVCPLSLAFSLLMYHPFFAVSVRRLSLSLSLDFPVHTFLPYLPVLQAQGKRISARGREVWLSGQVRPQHKFWAQRVRQDQFCGQWHDAHWRSRSQWNLWLLKNTHSRTLDCSVFPQFLNPQLRTFLMMILLFKWKAKKACIGKPIARQRERKEKVLWSVLQSRCQRKVDGTILGVIVFRLSENSILMDEISENIFNEELDKPFLVKIQIREDYTCLSTTRISRIWNEEIQNTHWLIYSVSAWISKDNNYWKPIRASSTWENTVV